MASAATTGVAPRGAWRRSDDYVLSPILASALDAFYEVGYHGTSVRDIARRTGLTVPALYYHHVNKEAILAALLDQSIESVIQRCEQALAEAGPDPDSRFRNLVECLVLYMAHNGKSAAMDAEIRALSPDSRRGYSTKRRRVERLLTDAITDGVTQGTFHVSSPTDTARALLGMIQAITIWFKPGGRLSAQLVAERYLDIAEHTVGARP
jgi:AcrR family transcriptional regulator